MLVCFKVLNVVILKDDIGNMFQKINCFFQMIKINKYKLSFLEFLDFSFLYYHDSSIF